MDPTAGLEAYRANKRGENNLRNYNISVADMDIEQIPERKDNPLKTVPHTTVQVHNVFLKAILA